jgi:hypothetical protein
MRGGLAVVASGDGGVDEGHEAMASGEGDKRDGVGFEGFQLEGSGCFVRWLSRARKSETKMLTHQLS